MKKQLNYSCASSLSKAVIAKSAETFYLSLVVNLNSVPINEQSIRNAVSCYGITNARKTE